MKDKIVFHWVHAPNFFGIMENVFLHFHDYAKRERLCYQYLIISYAVKNLRKVSELFV